ncbi:MAG: hypothetical protein IJV80_05010, partial [Clostridia bacterium]|nr:hypothetical protein [Clostridia bacterium]
DKSKTYTVEYSSTFLTFSYGDGVDAWKQGTATVTGLEYYPIPYAPPAYATVVFNYTYDETAGFVATIDTANSTAAYLAPMTEDYWEGGTLTTTKEISLTMSADMKLVLAMNTIYDYDAEAEAHDVQDYEWSDESEMIVASATDVLAAKCGMSTYEANSGYFLLNGEEVVANINFWSDGSGTLKVANGNPGELFSINFSFELVEGQDGYTVNFSNASLDAWGYDFAANDLVTEDAGVYTIAATTISADMSTITIGTTVLSLIS